MAPDPRSIRFAADELAAIDAGADRLDVTPNGFVRYAVRQLAGLPVPDDVRRLFERDVARRQAAELIEH